MDEILLLNEPLFKDKDELLLPFSLPDLVLKLIFNPLGSVIVILGHLEDLVFLFFETVTTLNQLLDVCLISGQFLMDKLFLLVKVAGCMLEFINEGLLQRDVSFTEWI